MRITLVAMAFAATTASYASEFESRYFASVFSGDLSWVADAAPSTPSGLALKAKFDEHFILRVDSSSITDINDPIVNAIARRYLNYWREALLAPSNVEDAEGRLMTDIFRLITLDGIAAEPDDIDGALTELLARRGFGYRGGRTSPLLDFMLWRETRTARYDIELTDTQQNVVVHFLDDFVIRGWSHFATFGRAGTGGWADRDVLYCIADAYDLESEGFTNSYLRHEARHFADYERYPELEGADLEYRGKLTELAFSFDAQGLLRRFRQHGNGASAAPHPLANWYVVNDMAAMANPSCGGDPLQCLESVSNEDLRAAAGRLLDDHSTKLDALGAETISTTLEPVKIE